MNLPAASCGVSKNLSFPDLIGESSLSPQKRGTINKLDSRLHGKPWIIRSSRIMTYIWKQGNPVAS